MDAQYSYEDALLDPAAAFATPQAVVDDAGLTREQKIELLRRWQYDADEMDVAEEEGMAGGEPSRLSQVLAALKRLGATMDPEHTSPMKQDGA
jgi:hypothetical protein